MTEHEPSEHPRTTELLESQERVVREGEIIKRMARVAVAEMRDAIETLARTEIDLADIIDYRRRAR